MHGRYVKGQDARNRSVSWHFTVDDREIRQHLPINERGWHSGAGNIDSVGIEICVNADGNWQKAKANAQKLIAHLQSLGISVITTHRQETGKNCPARLLREGFASFLAGVNSVEQVKSETTEDEVIYVLAGEFEWGSNKKAFEQALRRYGNVNEREAYANDKLKLEDALGVLAKGIDAEPSDSVAEAHRASWDKAKRVGVLNGERPKHFTTREQLASVLDRTGHLD
ncbi:N-acetylmuramoyl-L-alanine amidase CwlH precursor [Geomicrobium sp. JCM 19037]|uniref:peptidoglycan recognition protein family protein n=1 Tax=Geomicrobium sp. JCM 19037 TaxID=1460634 RepID=UPI00045F48BD|nr:N-acetylmuramoyl-L-alanine amidase [Geomicrobium sp. JCM 19037]GAK03134.1 N-acetylmuramoyl-L-alanine amidase CwlH precursor [Geomicrobium sp. JCM 19037]